MIILLKQKKISSFSFIEQIKTTKETFYQQKIKEYEANIEEEQNV
jgi:hypothetical protein